MTTATARRSNTTSILGGNMDTDYQSPSTLEGANSAELRSRAKEGSIYIASDLLAALVERADQTGPLTAADIEELFAHYSA